MYSGKAIPEEYKMVDLGIKFWVETFQAIHFPKSLMIFDIIIW